jgi:hypothetical protein
MTTNYPLEILTRLSAVKETDQLQYHQELVRNFFTKTDQRGLLVCHAMGMGKTRIAVAIAINSRKLDPNRKIIVLSARSLADNFRKEVIEYTKEAPEYVDRNFNFISLNSGRMFNKVRDFNKTGDELELERKFGDFLESTNSSLTNTMLIIDEAHNFFNAVTNGAKNALALYDLVMKTDNIKLIFLTGNPIINHPFELVPCFNMLRGIIKIDDQSGSRGKKGKYGDHSTTLFSENLEEFENYFVHDNGKIAEIKNKDKFTNRIFGLSSYYADLYFDQSSREGFPKELPIKIEYVPMSIEQFATYTMCRISEMDESKSSYKSAGSRFAKTSGSFSTYRVKSRQCSNYCIPEYALGPASGSKSRVKYIDKITADDLHDLPKWSPKMAKIMENIDKHEGQNGIVYSQFVAGEGLGVFQLVLKNYGWRSYHDIHDDATDVPTYAVLSGDIDPDERAAIIATYNAGGKIQLLLLSGAVAEGIDLKKTRHVHIMEPFWNYARINQVKARAIRFKSHIALPLDQQNVQVYIYLSDYPRNTPAEKKHGQTTDVDLYNKSILHMRLIDSFIVALAESSIDCSLHYKKIPLSQREKISCKMCAPTNLPLYHPVITKDMLLPSACQQYTESKVEATEIIVDGVTYYYKPGDIPIIYKHDDKLAGYVRMQPSDFTYAHIYSEILKKTNPELSAEFIV